MSLITMEEISSFSFWVVSSKEHKKLKMFFVLVWKMHIFKEKCVVAENTLLSLLTFITLKITSVLLKVYA